MFPMSLSFEVFLTDIVESSVWRRRGMRNVLRKEVTPERFEVRRLFIPMIIREME
jgi:hypothetical protein